MPAPPTGHLETRSFLNNNKNLIVTILIQCEFNKNSFSSALVPIWPLEVSVVTQEP